MSFSNSTIEQQIAISTLRKAVSATLCIMASVASSSLGMFLNGGCCARFFVRPDTVLRPSKSQPHSHHVNCRVCCSEQWILVMEAVREINVALKLSIEDMIKDLQNIEQLYNSRYFHLLPKGTWSCFCVSHLRCLGNQ